MSDIKENTLGIVQMGVYKTLKFMKQFTDKHLVVWSNADSMFNVHELASYSITRDNDPLFVFHGKGRETCAFLARRGFGFKVFGASLKYWIDAVNEDDIAVIVYSSRTIQQIEQEVNQ